MLRLKILLMALVLCRFTLSGQAAFPYPDVPDSLTTPEARTAYLALHFWEKVDFTDVSVLDSSKPALDFIYLLSNTEPSVSDAALSAMLVRSSRHDSALGKLIYWFSHFLHDAKSPLFNDWMYADFLKAAMASDAPSEIKDVLGLQLEVVERNQTGSKAEDFVFADKEGREYHIFNVDAPYILLMFTNPDCSICREVQEEMSGMELLDKLQKEGKLKVVAIFPGTDYELWCAHKYPDSWLAGYELSGSIKEERLYEIQYYPCFYLLDSAKNVLIKEAEWGKIKRFICKKWAD